MTNDNLLRRSWSHVCRESVVALTQDCMISVYFSQFSDCVVFVKRGQRPEIFIDSSAHFLSHNFHIAIFTLRVFVSTI